MGGDYVTLNQLVTAFNRTGSYSYKMISWVENRGLPVHNKRVLRPLLAALWHWPWPFCTDWRMKSTSGVAADRRR